LRWRALQTTCALAVATVSGLTLGEHLSGINFGLDTLLSERNWGQAAAASPMRMGPPASTAFLLAGAALVLLNRGLRARRMSAVLAMVVVTIPMLSLIGYLYGAAQMYTIPSLTGISLQTASVLLLLGAGLVASTPECEPMRAALDQGAGGLLVRRAFPLVVLAAIALGWLRVWLQNAGLVDTAVGTASRTLVEIALLAILLWWAAATVRLHDWALRDSEAKVRRQAAQLGTLLETAAVGMHRVDRTARSSGSTTPSSTCWDTRATNMSGIRSPSSTPTAASSPTFSPVCTAARSSSSIPRRCDARTVR
jgi:hypothetical protein